ncbi:endo-alpha-N-acetylgalactosaminidase family protein [Kribbella catacumbae]|uniref:endo-alpha-N-acetylgalactosaminidase family protein n=1 Tax=Kribbella catacumbae TaxID=460086 RepID=UPI000375783F|nr:endo-alpha-N-acetylgalactosaminidase family protein [Kribbella catacumbae]
MRRSHRRILAAVTTFAAGVALLGSNAAQPLAAPPPSISDGTALLTSDQLTVTVSKAFPQVIRYAERSTGAWIDGSATPLTSVKINGATHEVKVDAAQVDQNTIGYKLSFPGLDGVMMTASLHLTGRVTTFAITGIEDTAEHRVGTIDIPGHDLMSVDSTDARATTATAVISANRTTAGDTVTAVTAATSPDAAPVGSAYAIVSTSALAAALETNSVYDQDLGSNNRRIWRQSVKDGQRTRVGFWSGQWTYRAAGAPFTEELPWAKVTVTPDANADGEVDWQDGAIALRDIAISGNGAKETPDRVIAHIPYNFGSMATHPFLRTLDDVKRISLATDGLGQMAILKGYQSEGHDSAHPDYGGNINKRAGGLTELNTLLKQGAKWGAEFGVHVNATEAYPVAKTFKDELVNANAKGWNWLDQSYYIDQRRDLTSGDVQRRFAQLRAETDKNLALLYLDVYASFGWKQDRLAKELTNQGWNIATEWSYAFDRQAVWTHWANDESYGGATNKGLNSDIIRFVRNTQKDTWNPHPILGNAELRDFEGWTSEVDWNFFYDNVWQRNLPTKFLQQHEIVDWEQNDIRFTDGVRATDTGGRKILVGDAVVLQDDAYLLPWKTDKGGPKMYHYNADGGTTSWQLTDRFAPAKQLALFKLTDQGRTFVRNVPVKAGAVTIEAEAKTAYILAIGAGSGLARRVSWGEASNVDDPGFNSGKLDSWTTTGEVAVERDAKGQYETVLKPGARASISQRLTGLAPGSYAANIQVEVQPGMSRKVELRTTSGGVTTQNHVERSAAYNYLNADEKQGTYTQNLEVRFTVPPGASTATLSVQAVEGEARVELDNVRVVPTKGPRPTGVVAKEDFEDVTQGWYPFVKGDTGGIAGPRTHIAQKNAPYTQKGWNGKLVDDVIDGEESLKAHEERVGLVYRTVPQTARFEAGRRYRVSFDYQNSKAGWYSWAIGFDSIAGGKPSTTQLSATPIPEKRETARFSQEFDAGACGDTWVGLRKLTGAGAETDFIMDNFQVEDVGLSEGPTACATQEIATPSGGLVPGEQNRVTTTFTNLESDAVTNVRQSLEMPAGWTVAPDSATGFASVAPGAKVTTGWLVTPPEGTQPGSFGLAASSTYAHRGVEKAIRATATVTTVQAGKIPQSRLRIAATSSEEAASPASRILDGDAGTGWHTKIAGPAPYPHWVSIDLGANYEIRGFDYQNRVGNRSFKDYEISVSTDGQSWGEPIRTGSLATTGDVQHLELPVRRGRYVKLAGLTSATNSPFGGADEVGVWGTPAP